MHSLKTIVFQIDIILKVSKSQKHFFLPSNIFKKTTISLQISFVGFQEYLFEDKIFFWDLMTFSLKEKSNMNHRKCYKLQLFFQMTSCWWNWFYGIWIIPWNWKIHLLPHIWIWKKSYSTRYEPEREVERCTKYILLVQSKTVAENWVSKTPSVGIILAYLETTA